MATISPAGIDDVPQLADLLGMLFEQEADFEPNRAKQENGLRLILESPSTGIVLVAREDTKVVGMVSLLFTISTSEGGPVCWLEDMVVHPDSRGSGLGSRLLQAAIEYAWTNQYRRITLLTDKANAQAIRFYGRHGFLESAMTTMRLTQLKTDPQNHVLPLAPLRGEEAGA